MIMSEKWKQLMKILRCFWIWFQLDERIGEEAQRKEKLQTDGVCLHAGSSINVSYMMLLTFKASNTDKLVL